MNCNPFNWPGETEIRVASHDLEKLLHCIPKVGVTRNWPPYVSTSVSSKIWPFEISKVLGDIFGHL